MWCARIISSLLVCLMTTLLFVTPECGGVCEPLGALPTQVLPPEVQVCRRPGARKTSLAVAHPRGWSGFHERRDMH